MPNFNASQEVADRAAQILAKLLTGQQVQVGDTTYTLSYEEGSENLDRFTIEGRTDRTGSGLPETRCNLHGIEGLLDLVTEQDARASAPPADKVE